jgi:hypothetical protein
MAKRKSKRGTVAGYFRQVFAAQPEWLKEKSNDPILAKYRIDHGMAVDAPIEKSVKANLANLKSVLRKKSRRRGKAAAGGTAVASTRSGHRLEKLEELIDDCLTLAKNLDREALEHIISLLRRARNEVVWKIGE